MKNHTLRLFVSLLFSIALTLTAIVLMTTELMAQCAPLVSGLEVPLSLTQSDRGNLIVSESGTVVPNSGRISLVDREGNRRTFVDGLPSGINDVGEISGPAGLALDGDTLYVAIGIGDTIKAGPVPGTAIPNPVPSSTIFSSILAIEFNNYVERNTAGFTLTTADQQALANGERVKKSNGGAGRITLQLIANFPDTFPEPSAAVPNNVRASNPFHLTLVEDKQDGDRWDFFDHDRKRSKLYVTDGGRNLVWQADPVSGAFSILAVFSQVANPMFPALGAPFIDAVPTGIAHASGQLLVTLFRGVPFPPGTSMVAQVDPQTGSVTTFISGLKTAIDVLPLGAHHDRDYLVLQHASAGPFFNSPGLLLRFETPAGPPAVSANCLNRPTSMTLDARNGTLYATELVSVPPGQPVVAGRIVALPVVP